MKATEAQEREWNLLTKKIKEIRKEIRKKTLSLLLNQAENQTDIETALKPISEPLEKIISLKEERIKLKKENAKVLSTGTEGTTRKKISTPLLIYRENTNKNANETLETPVWDSRYTSTYNIPPLTSSKSWDEIHSKSTPSTPNKTSYPMTPLEDLNKSRPLNDPTTSSEIFNKSIPNTPPLREKTKRESLSNSSYYLNLLHSNDDRIDRVNGVVFRRGQYELNRIPIKFITTDYKTKMVEIEGVRIKLTRGINELLFLKNPNPFYISQLDERNYKKIAELAAFTGERKLNTLKSIAYLKGKGLLKLDNNKKKEYIFWDDVNELVERLELLHASTTAGNNRHNNEIVSIVSELKEGNYIK